ncbi:Mrr restriction system protein [Nonlabens ulvanivorans]|uniref:restriction endonuclease n=1 Tax=Nonlabens ulvanivorans TaxID=906888 RepID=UPI003265607C
MPKKPSKSQLIATKTIYATLQLLKDNDGEMRGKEVVDHLRENLEFNDYEKHIYEKTGYVRWESVLHFYTIDAMKAGFLRKNKGTWIITSEGEKVIEENSPEEIYNLISKGYKKWEAANKKEKKELQELDEDEELEVNFTQQQKSIIDQVEADASSGIRDYIINKNPYEFQDLVGALLEAMGYHVSSIAERGPDGGIDIIAYTDPLGTKQPRIIVQVKHKPESAISSDEIQKLSGTLKRNSDVGIFVTSGRFSKPSRRESLMSREHIELIDFDRFVELWQEYYPKMDDDKKSLLPLHPVYFLGTN